MIESLGRLIDEGLSVRYVYNLCPFVLQCRHHEQFSYKRLTCTYRTYNDDATLTLSPQGLDCLDGVSLVLSRLSRHN